MISGRRARRQAQRDMRRRGAGWTRRWRKGRGVNGQPRHPRTEARP